MAPSWYVMDDWLCLQGDLLWGSGVFFWLPSLGHLSTAQWPWLHWHRVPPLHQEQWRRLHCHYRHRPGVSTQTLLVFDYFLFIMDVCATLMQLFYGITESRHLYNVTWCEQLKNSLHCFSEIMQAFRPHYFCCNTKILSLISLYSIFVWQTRFQSFIVIIFLGKFITTCFFFLLINWFRMLE